MADVLRAITQASLGRIRKTSERPPRVSVYDVIGAITGKNSDDSGKAYRRLVEQFPEVGSETEWIPFKGQGQRLTPACNEETMKKILSLLPGKSAAIARATGRVGPPRPSSTVANDLYVIRYSNCEHVVKIGRAADVEAHRASLEQGQNFFVLVEAVFPGKGELIGAVQTKVGHKRCLCGPCGDWFCVSVTEALEAIKEAISASVCQQVFTSRHDPSEPACTTLVRNASSNRRWFSTKALKRMHNLVA